MVCGLLATPSPHVAGLPEVWQLQPHRFVKWEQLIETAIRESAADILLSPGSAPVLRIGGELVPQPGDLLTGDVVRKVIERIVSASSVDTLLRHRELDFAVDLAGRRFRGNAFFRRGEPGLALRLLPAHIPTPAELGLPAILQQLVLRPQGLVLFTGAAGQGKTTSQASLLAYLSARQARHIVTIEDPIEYVHEPARCVIDQREVGSDTTSFVTGLRQVLRQAPDVILVGEMRDLDTISAVVSIAETGHLVFSTLHTHDAVQALVRIVNAYPDGARAMVRTQLSLALSAVITQRLIRAEKGLVLACEVLINTPAIAAQIREGHFQMLYSAMELDHALGSQTMNASLDALVTAGKLSAEVAERFMIGTESRRKRTPSQQSS
jgi:twitching motility protein PilT